MGLGILHLDIMNIALLDDTPRAAENIVINGTFTFCVAYSMMSDSR
jgi:hypothetical protein